MTQARQFAASDLLRGGLLAALAFSGEVVLLLLVSIVGSAITQRSWVPLAAAPAAVPAAIISFFAAWFIAVALLPVTWALARALSLVSSPWIHACSMILYGAIVGMAVGLVLTRSWSPDVISANLLTGALTAIACGVGWWLAIRRRPSQKRGQAHTGAMDEIVALYDTHGREVGRAPRSAVRRDNLHHAATGVVVFNGAGELFVHRRTETKDVFPGRFDFAAGGVLLAEEDPTEAARREVREELGVTSTLVEIGEADYTDAHTSYHAFLFWTVTDEPLTLQSEEVHSGQWIARDRLLAEVESEPERFMPDAVALLAPWLRSLTATPPSA